MPIHRGSRLTVNLFFRRRNPDNTVTARNLAEAATVSVEVKRPRTPTSGQELMSNPPALTVTDPVNGVAKLEFAEGQLDAVGRWSAQGIVDGYRSNLATWRVEDNEL